MELEQLPQTIKKGQKDINSDVSKGGVGRGAADARAFISTEFKSKMTPLCLTVLSELEIQSVSQKTISLIVLVAG